MITPTLFALNLIMLAYMVDNKYSIGIYDKLRRFVVTFSVVIAFSVLFATGVQLVWQYYLTFKPIIEAYFGQRP